jgi:hypothetical protein
LLEEILADADLDVLGRDDFFSRGQALRAEREALGKMVSDEQPTNLHQPSPIPP